MPLFRQKSLNEKLAQKKGEYTELCAIISKLEEFPFSYLDKRISLAGEIAKLEEKLKSKAATQCTKPTP